VKKGEKILSFVKYEKELESSYRHKLDEIKRPDEVGNVFREFVFKLLKKVKDDIPDDAVEQINFRPEDGEAFEIGEELIELLGEKLVEKSDLMAIIGRMAQSAQHRYKKIKNDDERTDLFRIGDGAKPY